MFRLVNVKFSGLRKTVFWRMCLHPLLSVELDDGACPAVHGEGHDDAVFACEQCGREGVAQFCGNAIFHAQPSDGEVVGQQFHGHADVVGVVDVPVVVYVGPHHGNGLACGALLCRRLRLGQDDAAVLIVHVELRNDGHAVDGGVVDPFQFSHRLVHKGTHAPRLVAGLSLGIVDERVAESEHGLHAVDRGLHGQFLFVVRHSDDVDLSRGKQLCHVLFFKILLHDGLAVDPHLRAVLHHLKGGAEFQLSVAVAGAGRYFIFEAIHDRKVDVPLPFGKRLGGGVAVGWSWRESNPRPNGETIRFLHAYSRLHFRAPARPGPPIRCLIL